MKFRELHCILYIEGSKANSRQEVLRRCYTTWTKWMFIVFRMSTLIVASKLLTFLTVSTNNSLQLFHSKHCLRLSDNSFKKVLMQQVELNTIRRLLPGSNWCCQITYSKHFLYYQIIHIKQNLLLLMSSFKKLTDLNQTTKTRGPTFRRMQIPWKTREIKTSSGSQAKRFEKQCTDISNAKPTINKPVLQIKK